MKKYLSKTSIMLILGFAIILVGFTTYKEGKVYSEKDIPTYDVKTKDTNFNYIVRNEALKIAKDTFKNTINLDLDALDFKEEVTLNKDEKQNISEWNIKWKSKNGISSQEIVIDASTGEIKYFHGAKRQMLNTKEVYKLSKDDIDALIEETLKTVKRDMKDFKISYDSVSHFSIDGANNKKEGVRHSSSLKNGYVERANFRGINDNEEFSITINAKEKKVTSFSIRNKEYYRDNEAKGTSILIDSKTGKIKDIKKLSNEEIKKN